LSVVALNYRQRSGIYVRAGHSWCPVRPAGWLFIISSMFYSNAK